MVSSSSAASAGRFLCAAAERDRSKQPSLGLAATLRAATLRAATLKAVDTRPVATLQEGDTAMLRVVMVAGLCWPPARLVLPWAAWQPTKWTSGTTPGVGTGGAGVTVAAATAADTAAAATGEDTAAEGTAVMAAAAAAMEAAAIDGRGSVTGTVAAACREPLWPALLQAAVLVRGAAH